MKQTGMSSVSELVAAQLPYMRRYARALTGNQVEGDGIAMAALERVLADPAAVDGRVALFGVLHRVWAEGGARVGHADSRLSAAAQAHLAGLTRNAREALLLQSLEGFGLAEVGAILGVPRAEAQALVDRAVEEMARSVLGRILVIEDEAIIAMDLTSIIEDMGHEVTGVARTRTEALRLARTVPPHLVLADIQLADNSSGIDAVNDILATLQDVPVIFITAFPERLLTGERPEPAFLINKPYTEEQVRSAVSQAMFFASTETLTG